MNELINELADKAIEDMPGAWNIPDAVELKLYLPDAINKILKEVA